jgi:hypothetical protein
MASSLTWQVADEIVDLIDGGSDGVPPATPKVRDQVRQALTEALENRGCTIIETPAKLSADDPTAAACPHCRTVNPKRGVTYAVVEIPTMGQIVLATVFCGECHVMLATQILEMQMAALAAQKAGFAPQGPGGLWTPPRPGN